MAVYFGCDIRRVNSFGCAKAVSFSAKGMLIFGAYYFLVLFQTPENVWWLASHIWKSNPEGLSYKAIGMKQAVWMADWMRLLTSPILSITYNKRIDEIKRAIEHHLVNHSELNEKTKGGVQISSVTEIEASFFVARLCAFKAARNSILPRIFAFLFINTILGGIRSMST